MTKVEALKEVIGLETYSVVDYWIVCPYEPNDMLIDSSRREPQNTWRKIGMSWYALSGYTSANAGDFFSRDHASVLHALQTTKELIQVGDPLITQAIELMKNQSKLRCSGPIDKQPTSAMNLELYLFRSRPYVFDTEKFYCNIESIGSRMGGTASRCKNQCNACKS